MTPMQIQQTVAILSTVCLSKS